MKKIDNVVTNLLMSSERDDENLINDFVTSSIMYGTGIKCLVIREIAALAQKYNISKVILFGSRARGDFKRTSDIDLAVEGGDFERFALDINEETSTLLKYDIVDLNRDVQQELLDSIKKEGKVIYEKV